jgi:MYXO-CTERM domain-containing protein
MSMRMTPTDRPPSVLLISIGGAMALLALAAAWLWVTRGAAILLDLGQMFCL